MLVKDNADSLNHITKSGSRLFDPIALAAATEKVVCRGDKKKYFTFGMTWDYKTGVATGYTVGCNLRCVFCWSHSTRDDTEIAKDFFSPEELFERLAAIARKKQLDQVRISDAEPTIGKEHLLKVIELVERSNIGRFVLETNGILLGHDKEYVKSLAQFKKKIAK